MTLLDAEVIFRHWRKTPPVHHLVSVIAKILGWKPRAEPARDVPQWHDLVASLPPGLGAIRGASDLGMPAPILDLEEFRKKNQARALEIARRNMESADAGE